MDLNEKETNQMKDDFIKRLSNIIDSQPGRGTLTKELFVAVFRNPKGMQQLNEDIDILRDIAGQLFLMTSAADKHNKKQIKKEHFLYIISLKFKNIEGMFRNISLLTKSKAIMGWRQQIQNEIGNFLTQYGYFRNYIKDSDTNNLNGPGY